MKKGFTLIELLVVISIIALMTTVIMASIKTAQIKARDARRQNDMQQIFNAIQIFYSQYGCMPTTSGSSCYPGYSESNAGTWDYSSQGGFMGFLVSSGAISKVPVDPINNMTDDGTAGQFAYRYFCYSSGGNPGVHLSYWRENGTWVNVKKIGGSAQADRTYICK